MKSDGLMLELNYVTCDHGICRIPKLMAEFEIWWE